MDDTIPREYRIVRGAQPRSLARQRSRAVIERETHNLVLHVTGDGVNGGILPDWFYDLRRKQLRIYGGLLRFIDVSVMRKVPKAVLLMIPAWIKAYIEEQYENDGGDGAPSRKVA